MSLKRKRTQYSSEGAPQVGTYRTTMYFDSVDSKTPLHATNNELSFTIPRVVEKVKSVKFQEIVLYNTLSPFNEDNRYIYWEVEPVGAGVLEKYSLDLAFEEYGFDRSTISLLGEAMNEVMNPSSGVPNPVNVSGTMIETFWDTATDYIGFVLRDATPAPGSVDINPTWKLTFPLQGNGSIAYPVSAAQIVFGLYERVPSADNGIPYVGVSGELGEFENNLSKVPGSEDNKACVVWTNGAYKLEGDTGLLIKCNTVKKRTTHSSSEGDGGDIKGVKASNILESIDLGTERGGLVRYGDFQFPQTNYRGTDSMSGTITFSFWHSSGSKPRFQYNTPVRITLLIEYDDD